MVPATKTTRAMAVSTRTLPTPNSLITPAAPMPARTGLRKFRFRFSAEARRQAMRGPTPMRKRRARKMGIFTRLKKGAPTLTLTPRTASDSSGKTVPKKTVKVAAIRKRLFRRKTDSRETAESSSPWARSPSVRHARSEKAPSRARARKARKKTPMELCVKEWTEPMMHERVRNVPNSVRIKVRMMRVRFQSLSMRRRMLKLWNLTLIILTFSLTLFGTFLTRSCIIGSVHSFTQGSIGVFFLAFLALALLGAFSLLAWRTDRLRAQGELDSAVSRESVFLLNNLFLIAATFTVFFGTVFPLLSEAVRGVKVSVGAPFFNLVNIPIFLALIFLMGVGPLIAWRRASAENLRRNFLMPVVIGVVGAALCRAFGVGNLLVLLCMGLVVFVAATIALDFWRAARARRRTGDGWLEATWGLALRQNRRYGGFVVHLGILVIALGVAGSQAWSTQTEATINRGATVELAGYTIRFDDLQPVEESNHFKVVGTFSVSDRRGPYTVLTPAKKFYPQEQTPIAAVDYRLGFVEDLYLVLGDFARDGSHATVKVQINRMVSWLWIGGLILTLGAALAIVPEGRWTAARPGRDHAVVA